MDKLLIIADDFTGALDTGVQFASIGTSTCVVTDPRCDYEGLGDSFQVLVVDAESRHLPPREAHDVVFNAVQGARDAGFTGVYKKTDSALRGNIGAELSAALSAAEADSLAFFPSFPRMGRVTRGGIHYINDIPVAESMFGEDPFEPVRRSAVAEIIGQQTDVPVTLHSVGDVMCEGGGIHVFDASTDQDLQEAALELKLSGNVPAVMAGCAGFAAVLPELMGVPADTRRSVPRLTGKLLTICGSVNPITMAQLDEAERAGALRLRLAPYQKLSEGWVKTLDGRKITADWVEQIQKTDNAIIECGVNDRYETAAWAENMHLTLDETRQRIANTMGDVLERVLYLGLERDILITGGDTLLSFMNRIGLNMLIPLGEAVPGVVLSQLRYGGRSYNLMTKSGGFGERSLLIDLVDHGKSH